MANNELDVQEPKVRTRETHKIIGNDDKVYTIYLDDFEKYLCKKITYEELIKIGKLL